jgi:hypothetical protein
MNACTLFAAAALAAALPAAVHAQGGYPGGMGSPGTGTRTQRTVMMPGSAQVPDLRNPVAVALVDSARLGLSAAQHTRLRALADSVDAENRPLLEQVQRTLSGTQVGNVMVPLTDSIRNMRIELLKSYFQRIRWNNEQAWKSARTILTHDQAKLAERIKRDADRGRNVPARPAPPAGAPPQPGS